MDNQPSLKQRIDKAIFDGHMNGQNLSRHIMNWASDYSEDDVHSAMMAYNKIAKDYSAQLKTVRKEFPQDAVTLHNYNYVAKILLYLTRPGLFTPKEYRFSKEDIALAVEMTNEQLGGQNIKAYQATIGKDSGDNSALSNEVREFQAKHPSEHVPDPAQFRKDFAEFTKQLDSDVKAFKKQRGQRH